VQLTELLEDVVVHELAHVSNPYVGETHDAVGHHHDLVINNAVGEVPLLLDDKLNIILGHLGLRALRGYLLVFQLLSLDNLLLLFVLGFQHSFAHCLRFLIGILVRKFFPSLFQVAFGRLVRRFYLGVNRLLAVVRH
jgi:hypothetical protein